MVVKKINKYILILSFLFFGITNPVFAASDYNHGTYGSGLYGTGEASTNGSHSGGNIFRELLLQIEILKSQIAKKQNQTKTQTPIPTQTQSQSISRTLKIGMTGEDVRLLQIFLTSQGFNVSTTSYFGPITKKSLIKFQEFYFDDILKPQGLKNGSGIYGPSTKAKVLQIQKNASIKSIH